MRHFIATALRNSLRRAQRIFQREYFSSAGYWQERYASGGNSGVGSYQHFAVFKADVLNRFVADHSVQSVIEFGCGDGNQLRLAKYPRYLGYDISPLAIENCRNIFLEDSTKRFVLLDNGAQEPSDLAISLDVIFHLVEDQVFHQYMTRLFDAAIRYVVIYSSNTDDNSTNSAPHVRHRKFTTWVSTKRPEWRLIEFIPNKYPFNGDYTKTSFCDFFIYQKQ